VREAGDARRTGAAMKKLRDTDFGRYLRAVVKPIHPVRALFEVCGTVLFSIPFLAAFALNRTAPLYVYLLYPALFLVSHFVWFRLPSVERHLRWALFWITLTVIVALGAGFLYWNYREAVAAGGTFHPSGIFWIPQWVSPKIDVPFPTVALIFLVPSGAIAAAYSLILGVFLRIYSRYRREEHLKREKGQDPDPGQKG
jgi:hypothetical protein